MQSRHRSCVNVLLTGLMAVIPAALFAEEVARDPQELMKTVVANELKKTKDSGRWMYRLRKETTKGIQVKEIIETDRGEVGRLIKINDQPLTAEQRAKEEERLDHLLKSPAEQEKKLKEQKQDEKHAEIMVQALADAFIYQYDGTESGKEGTLIRLKFEPKPNFSPPSRETEVYRGMAGSMWVDATQLRLAKIDGTLVNDVGFGWGGILGKLYKGGHFVVEQSRIAGDRWEATNLVLDLRGRAFVKSLVYKEKQSTSNFRPVPANLSLAQGIEMLRQQSEQEVAQK